MLNLSDNAITGEGFRHLIEGVKENTNLVALNLQQNDLNSNAAFGLLMSVFSDPRCSLADLNISHNMLTSKNIEDLAAMLSDGQRLKLQRLDVSHNRIPVGPTCKLLQGIRQSYGLKLTHLNLDKSCLDPGSSPEQAS